jgi:DnaJ-class molecular chaperone
MIWIVLFSVLSICLLYSTLKTERRVAKPGKDLRLDLSIGFYDAILGCETEVRIPRLEAISDDAAIPVIRLLKIMVPPGVDCGTKLKLIREGDASKNGGRPGDLFLQILAPVHDGGLQRKGLNIESEVGITKEQARMGGDLVVKTIWGDLNIVVPPKTLQGDTLVLKGCGVTSPGSPTKKGNHIIHFFCQEYEFNTSIPDITPSAAVGILPETAYLGEGWGEGI